MDRSNFEGKISFELLMKLWVGYIDSWNRVGNKKRPNLSIKSFTL